MTRTRDQVMMGVGALLVALVLAVLLGWQAVAPDAAAVAAAGEPAPQAATGRPASLAAGRSSKLAANGGFTVTLPSVMRNADLAYTSPFGVVMYGNVDTAAGLQSMKAAGAKSATTMLYWAAIQPTQNGPLDWSSFDIKTQNAQAAGLDLFVLFTGNPSWAAQYPGGPVTDTQTLVNFVTLMAQRYNCDGVDDAPGHPCVHNWSFYGEPDNGDPLQAQYGKGYWGNNSAGYAAMLEQISPAIHAIDPKAKVMIGGLAYDWFTTAMPRPGPFVQSFLGDVLAKLNYDHPGEVGKYLDAVAFHYYPISNTWPTIREKAQEIRGIMAANGAGSLPLLSPEMGYWSSTAYGSSEAQQANWLVQTYARGLSVDMKLLSWYKVFDDVVAGSPADIAPDLTAGLFHLDGTAKLSYAAYQTLTRELGFAHYVGPYQAPDVEGYIFNNNLGQQIVVLWGTATGTVRVTFPYTHLRVVTATGTAFDILDNQQPAGAPGDVDGGRVGQIQLEINPNQPIYVERK